MVSDGDYGASTGLIDNEKKKILKRVFWDMNEVVYIDKFKQGKIEVKGKTIEQMRVKYKLTEKQMKQIKELNNPEYNSMWVQAISGATSIVGTGEWAWPTVKNYIITEYYGYGVRSDIGESTSRLHAGVDIAGLGCNSPIYAAQSGNIEIAGSYYGYGNAVMINHNNGYKSLYGHMNRVLVKPGTSVNKGQQIGLMGNTGYSFGCHLHFQVEKNGKTFDPLSLY